MSTVLFNYLCSCGVKYPNEWTKIICEGSHPSLIITQNHLEESATMTVIEAATKLGVSKGRIRQLIGGGKIRAVKAKGSRGMRWVIDSCSVDDYNQENQRSKMIKKNSILIPPIQAESKLESKSESKFESKSESKPEVTKSISQTQPSIDRESVILRLLDELDRIKETMAEVYTTNANLRKENARLTQELDEATKPEVRPNLTEKEEAALINRAADLFPELIK